MGEVHQAAAHGETARGRWGPRMRRYARFLLDPAPLRRSLYTALVVGSVLTAVNHGEMLLRGDLSQGLLWQIPVTFVVPFLVTMWGGLINSQPLA